MNPRIAVASLWAEDVPAAAHFYRDVIGLQMLPQHGSRPHFEAGGCTLVILQGRPAPAQTPTPARFPLLALAVDDLEAAVQKLRAHQVALPWGIEADGQARWVMFYDPGGNLIELVQFGNGQAVGE